MFNSTGFGRGSGRGFGRRGVGTVTVIETKVHRSSARNARLAFWLTWFVVGLLAMTIAADRIHLYRTRDPGRRAWIVHQATLEMDERQLIGRLTTRPEGLTETSDVGGWMRACEFFTRA